MTTVDIEVPARVAGLRTVFRRNHGFLKDVVDRGAATFGPEWSAECEETITRLFPTDESLALAARGYALFVLHLLRAQRDFERERAYRAKTYAEAAAEVYMDDAYMASEYLPALLLSHYLWPHHYRQARFFDTAFASQMRLRRARHFVEIGVGTGLYSRRVLRAVPSIRGEGFDISPASKAFAEQHIRAFGLDDRYQVTLQDVIENPVPPCDWLVCVEVLEHLEDPEAFLRTLREALAPGGRAFITAALNAPHVDHIYLYEEPEEVMAQLRASGFALEQCFVGAAYKPPKPDTPVPTVAAFIVE